MTSRERDIAYGIHSNIPRCCIDFFVDVWSPQRMWEWSEYNRAIDRREHYNYVPCPRCFFLDRRVHLKDCLLECRRECWKDFHD